MDYFLSDEVKNGIMTKIIDFTEKSVKTFLAEHPGLIYYAFAYDCNVEYGEVNLCFNTEEGYLKILDYYTKDGSPLSEDYKLDLRYNTGDFNYQCFKTIDIDEEILFGDSREGDLSDGVYDRLCYQVLELFTKALYGFTQTEVFDLIPKTNDFKVYSIDHDEDADAALKRCKKLYPLLG